MQLTVTTEGDEIYTVEVDDSETVETLSKILEFESSIVPSDQELWHNNRMLQKSATLQNSNVANGDLILLRKLDRAQAAALPGRPDVRQLLQNIQQNQQLLNSLSQSMRTRVLQNDPSVVEEIISMANAEQEAMRQAEIEALNQDEFDPGAQARIAERIQQENIQANMDAAFEHSPEAFSQVTMLYVKLEVNGHPLKAFVDSGAQVCVMSRRCAEDCNIAHLIDKRWSGMMRGVGEQQSHGRIHTVSVKVGNEHLPMAVNVLEKSDVDLLFGLDMLRRYRCTIDLQNNCLRFGILENTSLEFLPDHEIPNRERPQTGATVGDTAAGSAGAAAAAGAAASARAAANSGKLGTPLLQVPSEQPSAGPQSSLSASQPSSAIHMPTGKKAAATAPSASNEFEGKVQQLVALGFPRQQCIDALKACNDSVDHAAAILFG